MPLDRQAYSDSRIWQMELAHLFTQRCCVGTAHEFSDPDHYLSLRLGSHAITCRGSEIGPRAWRNVCLHRNTLIDPPGSGERAFQCCYHGWRYNSKGQLSHAPFCDMTQINNQQLHSYPLATKEQLCFLGLDAMPDVSDLPPLLAELQLDFSQPAFHREQLLHDCNWKLLVENVLEGYHLNFVHHDSFLPAGLDSTTAGDWRHKGDSSWAKAKPDKPAIAQGLKHFPGAAHHYWHGYLFPNLFVANTNHLIGFISYLLPLSPTQTQLSWQLFELPALRALPETVRQQIRTSAIAFAGKTLQEDKSVVELCQQGLISHGAQVQLQPQEARIAHFHELYRQHSAST